MEEKLGKIVYNGRIYDLDDPENTEKLEELLKKLKQEEKDLKHKLMQVYKKTWKKENKGEV